MKKVFYDCHSKTVVWTRLRLCLGGNVVIMFVENEDGLIRHFVNLKTKTVLCIRLLSTFFPLPHTLARSYFIYHLCAYLRRSCSHLICRPSLDHSPPSLDHSPSSVDQSLSCLPRHATRCVVCALS